VHLSKALEDYEDFEGLSEEQMQVIRYSRAMLTYGVATSVSEGWNMLLTDEEIIEEYLTEISHALLEGFRESYARSGGKKPFLDDRFNKMVKMKG
jgi:hypothetical protein